MFVCHPSQQPRTCHVVTTATCCCCKVPGTPVSDTCSVIAEQLVHCYPVPFLVVQVSGLCAAACTFQKHVSGPTRNKLVRLFCCQASIEARGHFYFRVLASLAAVAFGQVADMCCGQRTKWYDTVCQSRMCPASLSCRGILQAKSVSAQQEPVC
jgi:hypothetical protein